MSDACGNCGCSPCLSTVPKDLPIDQMIVVMRILVDRGRGQEPTITSMHKAIPMGRDRIARAVKVMRENGTFDALGIEEPGLGAGGIRTRPSEETRWRVFERDDFRCVYCSKRGPLTVDHVVPVDQGGTSLEDNLVSACQPCNSRKKAMSLEEFEARRDRA